MQSVRRLVKCEDSPLQILVLMSALGLARGQGSADQFTSFAVGNWCITATCTVCICAWWHFHLNYELREERGQ